MKLIAFNDGHNASIAYMENGVIRFALEEERLSRRKNDVGFPELALNELIKRYNIEIGNIDAFIFSDYDSYGVWEKNLDREYWRKRFHTMFEKHNTSLFLRISKISLRTLAGKILRLIPQINNILNQRGTERRHQDRSRNLLDRGIPPEKIFFLDHHTCHASSAAYGWRMQEDFIVITSDGGGDKLSGSVSKFSKGKLERIASIPVADSIAQIYGMVTFYLGMKPLEHEFKIMGLAPYAQELHEAREIADFFLGLFEVQENELPYARKKGVEPTYLLAQRLKKYLAYKRFDHISAGLQLFTEEFISKWVNNILKKTGVNNLALSGGLFMNVKLNKKICELQSVDKLFVFPSCGDETNVFGALYHYYFKETGKIPKPLIDLYLGGDFSQEESENAIKNYAFRSKVKYEYHSDIDTEVARLLSEKKIVARFSGRIEFGARALGNRSILANPNDPDAVKTINKMIKSRDFWMPFAPSCIDADNYFVNPKKIPSHYMMLTFDSVPDKISFMKGAIHPYDNTGRPQVVTKELNNSYWNLINKFKENTGEGIILNTSFNLHGHPIVYSPKDALHVLDNSGLNYLALGNYLIQKINE